jgi:hypothetical protein
MEVAKNMRAVIALLILSGVADVYAGQVKLFAGARFNPKTWAKLQTFDVRTLSKDKALDAQVGRLVEVHFQFRSKEVRHLKPNWYQASIWQAAPEGRRGFVSVPILVANTNVNAFKAFTTDPRATADLKVYGQVLYDFGINYVFVRLIGTNTFVDSDGCTNISW